MAIRMRVNGELICAAMSTEEPDDIYIGDTLHYQLSVLSKAIIADVKHEENGVWHWLHNDPCYEVRGVNHADPEYPKRKHWRDKGEQ